MVHAYMRVLVEMADAVGVAQRGTPLDAMVHITLVQQAFGQVSAILARDARHESPLRHIRHPLINLSGQGRPILTERGSRRHGTTSPDAT